MRFRENGPKVNFTAYPENGFDVAHAFVVQESGKMWFCYNATMRDKPHDLAWVMDTGANIPVVGTDLMLNNALKIVTSPSMDVVVGGNNKITSTKTASFVTSSGVTFSARVIPNFGPNILPTHTLDVVKNGGRMQVANGLMQVFDKNGQEIITAYLCSDNLFRWWPEWPVQTRPNHESIPFTQHVNQRYYTSSVATPSKLRV